ncbi:MAG: amidohydrolase family protein [Bacteroidetes bacterium]|nr:amidohydrolase family protein [Bacteroidota bacterium]
MKEFKNISLILLFCTSIIVVAQKKVMRIALVNATIHQGNGNVIENGLIVINQSKIELVQKKTSENTPSADTVIDLHNKHIYPAFINTNNILGLHDAEAVRATRDFYEVGTINPHVRTLIAYNADNAIIPTVKTNGILYTQVTPRGGLISGSSSVVALEAWNWEDAVLKADDGIHLNMPRLHYKHWSEDNLNTIAANKKYNDEIEELTKFFTDANFYYLQNNQSPEKNLRFEAMKPVFSGNANLYIHADKVKDILAAIQFIKKFEIKKTILVGGKESYKVTNELKKNNISVMLNRVNDLPDMDDNDVDICYKTPFLLQRDSVLFCLQLEGDMEAMQSRNLPFNAGHAVAYGLTKEQALSAITLNAAKILMLDSKIGSLEEGKLASLIVSDGDALDAKSNNIVLALIEGKFVKLTNKQNELNQKYLDKYGIK